MDTWKSTARKKFRHGEVRSEKIKDGESQETEDAGARKGRKVVNTLSLQRFVALEGRKVGSLKRRAQRHLGRWDMKIYTSFGHEAHFEVKSGKARWFRTIFGSSDV